MSSFLMMRSDVRRLLPRCSMLANLIFTLLALEQFALYSSSPSTRRRITESSFNSRVIGYRSNVGSLKERALQGVEGGFKFLPGYPRWPVLHRDL